MESKQILQEIRSGNPDRVFRKLYNSFPAVRKHVKQNGGSRDDAKDIFQDALMLFYDKVQKPEFEFTSAPETFLFGICKMKWLERIRRQKPEGRSQMELAESENLGDERLPVAMRALKALGEKCKEILGAFYFRKMSIDAIAAKFGFSSESSAKVQKYKCLEAARNMVFAELKRQS